MRRVLLVLMVTFGGFALVACGSSEQSSETAGTAAPMAPPAPEALGGAAADNRKSMPTEAAPKPDRKEITTGSAYVTADDPIAASKKVSEKIDQLEGRIDQKSESPGTDNATAQASLTVRVPADKTEQFLDYLPDLGKVTKVDISKSDVTLQYEDVDARIKALQASADRLRALIAQATRTADLLEAENALTQRQAELDSLTAQQRRLNDQIDMSTLTIELTTKDVTPPKERDDNFLDAIADGWNALVDTLAAIVVLFGRLLPWIVFVGILAGLGYGLVRLTGILTRRRETPPPPPAPEPEKVDQTV